jgi:hypothetical protein
MSIFNNMKFSLALDFLKEGHRVARENWNGKGMFLFLVPGSTFKVNRPPLLGIYPEGTEINYRSHIDMKTAQGNIVPWVASQTDLLADDWFILTDWEKKESGDGLL